MIQRDHNPVNLYLQVVISQRVPLPASTIEDITELAPTKFIDIDSIAPPPRPEYSERTLCYHARQERTVEDCGLDYPSRRRGPYRPRNRATFQLCRDPAAAKDVKLFTIDEGFYNASNTCPYCTAQSWPAERRPDNRWPCCDNGKND